MRIQQNRLVAADDPQRMLLRCVLHDAVQWDRRITDACPGCQAIGDICMAHWDEHTARRAEYATLRDQFERCEGLAGACPLTIRQQQTIAAAVPEAIAYRQGQNTMGDAALLAAYRSLKRRLPARRAAGSLSPVATGRVSSPVAGITAAGQS